jgi:hypothetical protein
MVSLKKNLNTSEVSKVVGGSYRRLGLARLKFFNSWSGD